jgi:hypothetical protein
MPPSTASCACPVSSAPDNASARWWSSRFPTASRSTSGRSPSAGPRRRSRSRNRSAFRWGSGAPRKGGPPRAKRTSCSRSSRPRWPQTLQPALSRASRTTGVSMEIHAAPPPAYRAGQRGSLCHGQRAIGRQSHDGDDRDARLRRRQVPDPAESRSVRADRHPGGRQPVHRRPAQPAVRHPRPVPGRRNARPDHRDAARPGSGLSAALSPRRRRAARRRPARSCAAAPRAARPAAPSRAGRGRG